MTPDDLQARLATSKRLLTAVSRTSLSAYLHNVVINSQPEPRRFGETAEPWQRELIAPKIAAFEALAGLRPDYTGPRSFFDVLARGHDKSSLEARLAMWTLLAGRNPIRGYIVAADSDQGRLIVEAATEEWRHNDWLHDAITITKNEIIGPAGRVTVVASDAKSAYGLRGDLLILDELTHWSKRDVWTAIVSGRHKRPDSILCILSNAGLLGSWQYDEYEKAKGDPTRWAVFDREGSQASWLKADDIAESRKRLPPSEAKRLLDNKWIDPAEETDYLRREECEACEQLGASLGLFYRIRRDPAVDNYVALVDYGARNDRCVLAVMHQDAHLRTVVDRMDVWVKGNEKLVSPEKVRKWCEDVNRAFKPRLFVVDEWQMLATMEWMTAHDVPNEAFRFRAGQGNMDMAQQLRAAVVDRQIVWYPECGSLPGDSLVDELAALRVKRMSYGFRFDHENQKHDDRAVVLGFGAMTCPRFPYVRKLQTPVQQLSDVRHEG